MMMEIYVHKNYAEYVMAQKSMTRARTDHGINTISSVTEDNVIAINNLIHQYVNKLDTMVCHGCRSGVEVDLFQKLNPESTIFGTDIYGRAYKFDRKYFRQIDFDTIPEGWKGYFDVIYSNSIDHSRNPISTLSIWKSELKDNGIFYLTFWCGNGVSKANCFHLNPKNWDDDIKKISEEIGMKVLFKSEKGSLVYTRRDNFCIDVIMEKV